MENNPVAPSVELPAADQLRQSPVKRFHPILLPEVLMITSYPPRECGIASYSQDLIRAMHAQFIHSFRIQVCALESGPAAYVYPEEVRYILDTQDAESYLELAHAINIDEQIQFVLVQHEFGFYGAGREADFLRMMRSLSKPAAVVFHTVLPHPEPGMQALVQQIAQACVCIVVMTRHAAQVLHADYGVELDKLLVIPHGTHLVPHLDKTALKQAYDLTGRQVLSTFGLLSSGKSIETTLDALPEIILRHPETIFLVIGKTHPGVLKSEGESYREQLESKVAALRLRDHVRFINRYLPLQDLLTYLQLTDIYLFTSKDPNQAVSGTFSYAMSCGCPVISTPIPHAREVLRPDTGIIIDFQHPQQLAEGVSRLLSDDALRQAFSSNMQQQIVPSAWQNTAISYGRMLQQIAAQQAHAGPPRIRRQRAAEGGMPLHYRLPEISLEHVKNMTTAFGMIQFSRFSQPDLSTGYTLDDNARALIAVCMHYERTSDPADLELIRIYLEFIAHCQQPKGYFLNYVDEAGLFTAQNEDANLADANGRAIWALGYVISRQEILPEAMGARAEALLQLAMQRADTMYATRAMAFAIKGLYYYNLERKQAAVTGIMQVLADRLVQMYRHECEPNWHWYEGYLTYANSILPEAMLCAWQETGTQVYAEIAKDSFDFLLSRIFSGPEIKAIPNISWLHRRQEAGPEASGAEQPIDIAYTVLALDRFHAAYPDAGYADKMVTAFNWFLGHNHLHQIMYNPCTGGCYDGLEADHVNLNQGAESTVSYLLARLAMEARAA